MTIERVWFAAKDVASLSFSALALIVALTGAWFQFFRDAAHLNVDITAASAEIGADGSHTSNYYLGLLNHGNKQLIVTDILEKMYKVDKQKKAITDLTCPELPGGAMRWQSYSHDGKDYGNNYGLDIIVVNPDQFYAINKLHFWSPSSSEIKSLITENSGYQYILTCLTFDYAKYDGTEFKRQVPAVLQTFFRTENGEFDKNKNTVQPLTGFRFLE